MTRVFLAAGVAALAISAPASAGPKQDRQAARAERQQAQPRQQARAERQQTVRAERPQRAERVQMRAERPARVERQQVRVERPARVERQAARQQVRAERPARVERQAARQQVRETRVQPAREARIQQQQTRQVERQQARVDRQAQQQTMQAQRQELRANRQAQTQVMQADRQQLRADRQAARVQLRADNVARVQALAANRAAIRPLNTYGTRVLPLATAQTFIGVPLTTAATIAALDPLPRNIQYLYPDTPDYYYRYGDGYLYQVDRTSSLISALLPLLGGGYMPGSYLPQQYMSSYAPDYWGLNSFYPSSYDYGYGGYNPYGGYGAYGSQNICNRYANGVVYQVDCITGMIVNVIPTYAGGYGVGQLLPSAYSTYNVPYQYRSMYYDTPDYNYRYAPGAIYQVDPRSNLITGVPVLLANDLSVGAPLPLGYDAYNVPLAYRASYYDTPTVMYRYNDGYIYQVDPATRLITAVINALV